MAENKTVLEDIIPERSSPKITATVQDEAGDGIAASSLDTLTLTLYNLSDADKTIINSRSDQDVLNTNNVTVDSSGNLVWSVQALDTIIVSAPVLEQHRAVFAWTYSSGTKTGRYTIDMTIRNLEKVT